jgi:glycosyltransferase involved in cell wall biosynthesis
MQPLVSVLLPAYGEAPFIAQTLTSVYAQGYKNLEILILYSNPQPMTISLLKHFRDKYGNLKIFEFEECVNLSTALNVGLAHSNGLYISRIDSDDLMVSNRLHNQVEFLERNTGVVLVGGQKVHIDKTNQIIQIPPSHPKSSFIIQLLLKNGYCPIVHPSAMFRRDAALAAGGYSEELEYAEDYEFWTRLALFGKFRNLRDVLVAYRIHSHNKSKRDPTEVSHLKELMTSSPRAKILAPLMIIKFTNVSLLYLYHTYESLIGARLGTSLEKKRKRNRELALGKYLLDVNQIHL